MNFCKLCNIIFVPKKNSKGIFCSPYCYQLTRGTTQQYNCAECTQEIKRASSRIQPSGNIFCNKSCAAKFNNKKYPKRYKIRDITNCLNCNVLLKTIQKKFCSKTCCGIFKRQESVNKWLIGELDGSNKYGILKACLRNYLLEQANYKCIKCNWGEPNPSIDKVILCVDHIDGNWKNNVPENLTVLCYNCHTLTTTFGSLNKNGLSYERLLQQRQVYMARNTNG